MTKVEEAAEMTSHVVSERAQTISKEDPETPEEAKTPTQATALPTEPRESPVTTTVLRESLEAATEARRRSQEILTVS